MPDSVAVDLEDIYTRDGCIMESRIDPQGGTEEGPLPAQPLLSRILSSAGFHCFLLSVEITQESSSGSGRESCHEPFNWGWTTYMWMRKLVSYK